MSEQTDRIKNSIKLVIHGKDEVIDMVLCAILAKGHILLCEAGEGVFFLPSGRRVYAGADALDALLI